MPAMKSISVTSAAALTGVDRRTVRRWMGEGELPIDEVLARAGLVLSSQDVQAVVRADGGDADACAEVALLLQERGLHSRALEWLQRAADKGHADAMHWLGRAYIDGRGVEPDTAVGLMWLSRAASLGHAISQAQVAALTGRVIGR